MKKRQYSRILFAELRDDLRHKYVTLSPRFRVVTIVTVVTQVETLLMMYMWVIM